MSDPLATLASLLRASSIQDHDEVLKAANAALKSSKSNLNAQHTRVVALLKLDRFDDALRAIAEGGQPLEKECVLEKSYALYKTGQLQDARNTLTSGPSVKPSRAFRHLAAQIAYRAENFQDAADEYCRLASEPGGLPGEENDLKINLLATNSQLEWNGLGHLVDARHGQPSREDLEAFETAYNAACAYIARGDLARASVLLKRARDLCEASEDLSDDEKAAELLPILVQHAYVLTLLGQETEAAALQKSVTVSNIVEAPTRVVAQNNQVAIGVGEGNPYLIQRLLESSTILATKDKLFDYQASVLRRNKYALELQAQKFRGVEESVTKQIFKATNSATSIDIAGLGVIGAAAHTHLGTGHVALKQTLPILEKRPNDVGLLLTIIQLYLQMQRPSPALALLETFLKRLETAATPDHEDIRFAPGLVAVAVALYRLHGRQNSIRTELAKASAYWRSKPGQISPSLLRKAGIELLHSSNPEDLASAGANFEKLVSKPEKDAITIAGLVASFATSDYGKVEPYLENLTDVQRLVASTDVQTLIDAGVASIPVRVSSGKKRAAEDELSREKAVKRRRKKRLPKNCEEGKLPDPERWLPLRDRSTYRPKGKKGRKRAQEATQGGVVKEEETLELVGGAGAVKVEKATGGQAGKKKKKGKK
ncbi:SRP72 RNA-binding domain-containing protein [Biscogniauxia mediterranea]|nr:SRP72 RNA-binding domain-containing protein [Biscogniauxia mediterranea]